MRIRRHTHDVADRHAQITEREAVRRFARESLERDPLVSALEPDLLARRLRAL